MDSLEQTTSLTTNSSFDPTDLLRRQRDYFRAGHTLSLKSRLAALTKLKDVVKKNENQVLKALNKDLRKPEFEAYGAELGVFYQELDYLLKNLKTWLSPRAVGTPWSLFPSRSQIRHQPYGQVLICSPFNYPFQLMLVPLAGAIAAGNTVIGKPSEFTPDTSKLLTQIVNENFAPELAHIVLGDANVGEALSRHPDFDFIFFTGSTAVGRKVALCAAQNLTPSVLELGGKNPCLVTPTAPVEITARRVVWGKFFNAGQTCVAPDYLLIPENQQQAYLTALVDEIKNLYGENPQKSPDFARIVSSRHLDRLKNLMHGSQVFHGGIVDEKDRYFSPTILTSVKWEGTVMQEEIFGPILPLLTYKNLNEALNQIQSLPSPLACYVFSSQESDFDYVARRLRFGGGAYNDTLVHLVSSKLPTGGIGRSGWGNYRGRHSFETFSHKQGVVLSSARIDLPLRYPPYKKGNLTLLKRIMK